MFSELLPSDQWWVKKPQNCEHRGDIAGIEKSFAVKTRGDIFVTFCVHGH